MSEQRAKPAKRTQQDNINKSVERTVVLYCGATDIIEYPKGTKMMSRRVPGDGYYKRVVKVHPMCTDSTSTIAFNYEAKLYSSMLFAEVEVRDLLPSEIELYSLL